jgi:hypothetical protein
VNDPTPADQAGALEVLLCTFSSQYADVSPSEALDLSWGFLSLQALDALGRELTEDEMNVAGACLGLELELRDREWRALERLLPHTSAAGIQWPTDREELGAVAGAILDLGWHRTPTLFGTPARRWHRVLWGRMARPVKALRRWRTTI